MIDTLKGFLWGIIICAVISCLCSCKTKYVTVPEVHTEYIHQTDSVLLHDSIYQRDSVYCALLGDTLYIERWHTKYIEKAKYLNHTDTVCKTDSITTPVYIEKKLSWFQKFRLGLLNWILGAVVLALGLIVLYVKRK